MDENVGQRESKKRREFLPQEMNWHGELHGFQDHKKIINDDIRQVSKLEKSSSMQTPMVWTSRERPNHRQCNTRKMRRKRSRGRSRQHWIDIISDDKYNITWIAFYVPIAANSWDQELMKSNQFLFIDWYGARPTITHSGFTQHKNSTKRVLIGPTVFRGPRNLGFCRGI